MFPPCDILAGRCGSGRILRTVHLCVNQESISDILIALEGILQSKNVSVLIQATDVSLKLVSSVGNLARQYPVLEIVTCLASQLSASQITIAVSSASTLNCILNTLATARSSIHAEIWEALEKTDAVTSVIGALQNYSPDVHPLNYLMEMMSLLRIILWIWPSSRYHVWSNCNLMGKLAQYCVASEMDVAVRVLKLYAALGTPFLVITFFDLCIRICIDLFAIPLVSSYLPNLTVIQLYVGMVQWSF